MLKDHLTNRRSSNLRSETLSDILDPSIKAVNALRRVRRIGWVLTGNKELSDSILLAAMGNSDVSPFDGPLDDPLENLFVWAFRVIDKACSEEGVIRSLRPKDGRHADLTSRVRAMPYELRIATLLITIECLDPDYAATISGRSAFSLASGAMVAVEILNAG